MSSSLFLYLQFWLLPMLHSASPERAIQILEGNQLHAKPIRLPHVGFRNPVAFSPDGKFLATGGMDNLIRLWNVPSGKPALSFAAHSAPAGISRLAFFPDGKTLASASWAGDGTVKLWGKENRLVGENEGGISFIAVAPTGKHLAWGGAGKIHLYDVVEGKETRCFPVRYAVDSAAFSSDGATLATAIGGGVVCLWDVASGEMLRTLQANSSTATGSQAVAFSPDRKMLATAGRDLNLWDAATGRELRKTAAARDETGYYCIAFSPDGRLLAAGTWLDLRLLEVGSWKEVRRWNERPLSVAISPHCQWLAFGVEDGAKLVRIHGNAVVK